MDRRELPGLRDIERAADRIEGIAVRTPLVESPVLSKIAGREVYLKLECFQPIKVFKIRGAYNKLCGVAEKRVVAASSGNHGIAVAYSSRLLGKKCTVVVPENAVKEKVDTILDFGADIVKFGRLSSEREVKAKELSKESGALFVHPFDDSDVIAGQGTCGLEIAEGLDEFDSVLVPVGGGGLISGISIATKSLMPRARVYGVEPAGAPKLTAALREHRITNVPSPTSMADGLLPAALGELAFRACTKNVEAALTVTEEEIFNATRIMVKEVKIIAEPSGSAPIAPLLSRSSHDFGRRVVVVVSGGNISLDLLARILSTS